MSIYRRVDRVLGFFSSSPNWDSPTPSPVGECVPPPLWFRGWVQTGLRERVWWGGGSQFRRGDRHCGTLGIYVHCTVLCAIYVCRYRSTVLTRKKRLRMKVTYLRQSILHLIEAPASRPPPHCMKMTLKISTSASRSSLRTSISASRSPLRTSTSASCSSLRTSTLASRPPGKTTSDLRSPLKTSTLTSRPQLN
jgi:hypothetical protein